MSVFFFSSRRRHTRFDCDWSSDVCSSDLHQGGRPVRVARRSTRSPAPLMSPLLDGFDFAALGDALAALGADAWLVYDFRHVNPVAERILGPTGMGSRRLFVLLPRTGKPVALAP